MRVTRLAIQKYRGIKKAVIFLPEHGVFIGDNNTGKTTVLEALDLVLGPDRLNHHPPIDEHDFFRGKYSATCAWAGTTRRRAEAEVMRQGPAKAG